MTLVSYDINIEFTLSVGESVIALALSLCPSTCPSGSVLPSDYPGQTHIYTEMNFCM